MKKSLFTLLALAGLAPAARAQTTPAPAPNTTPMAAPAVQKGPGTIVMPKEAQPVSGYYEGGQEALYTFLAQEVKYPESARSNRMQGRAQISFILNTDGSLSNVRVLLKPGGGISDEALRLLRLIKFKRPDKAITLSIAMDFKLTARTSNTTQN